MIIESSENQVYVVGSVYTDDAVGIAGVYTDIEQAHQHRVRMDDRRFAGDGIKFNFCTFAPIHIKKED